MLTNNAKLQNNVSRKANLINFADLSLWTEADLNVLIVWVPAQVHTSYLSRAPRAVPVEKIWSCGEICPHDRWSGGVILHMTDCHVEKILHMRNVKKI